MNNDFSFSKTIEILKEEYFDVWANIKYDVIMDFDVDELKKIYKNYINPFDDIVKYFEDTEEYEKCKKLFDLAKELEQDF